jgi:hypothetical protein
MAKLRKWRAGLLFHCPGCNEEHSVSEQVHTWNGSLDLPTFSPSLLWTYDGADRKVVCHSYVAAGRIQFLNDCTHKLAGQTADLPEIAATDG